MQQHNSSRRWWALGVLATAQFMVIMDTSIIGVALPDMQRALDFAPSELSWVFNAYVIAFGGLLLLGGKLSDLWGSRAVFSAGFAILTIGSLGAGLADSKGVEIAARAVQGVGAALIAPAGLALLFGIFGAHPRELTKALAVYGAAAPAGGTAGVFLGGVLTEWFDWPWVFFVNIPIGIAVLIATPRLLPAPPRRSGRLDLFGALTVTGALSLVVFAIVRAPEIGWGHADTIWSLAGGAALGIVFVVSQRYRHEPLLPPAILRTHGLVPANVVMALLGAAWVPMWYFLNLYVQQVLGFGPFEGGAALLPMTLLMMVLMVGVTERLIGRYGIVRVLATGLSLLAAGLSVLSAVDARGSFIADVLLGSLVSALGMSLAYIPAMFAAMSAARPEDAGLASGLVNTSYQVGSAIGLGAMIAVALSNGADRGADVVSLTDGFRSAFIDAAGIAGAGALVAVVLLGRKRAASPVDAVAIPPVGM